MTATIDALGRCSVCGLKVENSAGVCFHCTTHKYAETTPSQRPYTCPVCNGSGRVSRPPWIAGDVQSWSTSDPRETFDCTACEGSGVLWGNP